MSDIETSTVSEEGFASTSQVGDFELTIDATDEQGPNPNAVLVADYASCFLPAFRVGGQQRGHDDLGKIQIDADADLDGDDDLSGVRFSIHVEADLGDDEFDEIVARAEDICHVHAALREELHAEVDVHGGAF
ncbi:redox protein, regulator of disulfide bond formation [Halogeometricum borinquense DSM 11551]|uniref:Redox protein, regulator of disulfide bond formation n=2 Tax=Halogeometricum borinquense TaxID=60847 RepID=E4NNP0_HALBP|nr:OsmC family protein [Halogeometricum borinquense]ADQ67504.1 predicted redox protein, regulator of disulfide bond formation [Halogeometricum borinquense DSM 11551]ELY23814.1 redox protein, regulator of disulfide bond formation [Halogeometricum borinquense DSM 11551]RYJ13522.1 OsmC family peroxiredoxin [Halogeometricum borinquense]